MTEKKAELPERDALYKCYCHIKFPQCTYLLSFTKDEWTSSPGEAPDAGIKINTTPETMATFITVPRDNREEIFESKRVAGVQRADQ
jgi:hypothetical protein